MSLLKPNDILHVRISRKVNGQWISERVELPASDVRFLSTPELLRAFSSQIDRAEARLDAAEEAGSFEADAGQVCERCGNLLVPVADMMPGAPAAFYPCCDGGSRSDWSHVKGDEW